MSTVTSARDEPRMTALAWVIIMSSVTPSVLSSPCITMPRLSPTRMRSTCLSSSLAVCA